jgi:excisionase family DNA binding protein
LNRKSGCLNISPEVIAMTTTREDKQLLSIREAARVLGLTPWVAYRLARERRLPGLVRLGERRIYVRRAALEAWLRGENPTKDKNEVEIWP